MSDKFPSDLQSKFDILNALLNRFPKNEYMQNLKSQMTNQLDSIKGILSDPRTLRVLRSSGPECLRCGGSGAEPSSGIVCAHCGGTGNER
jgi:DnaJ-class molecular chaperone